MTVACIQISGFLYIYLGIDNPQEKKKKKKMKKKKKHWIRVAAYLKGVFIVGR